MLLGGHRGPLSSGQSCDGVFAMGQGHASFVQVTDLRWTVQAMHNVLQTKTAAQRMDALLRNENSFIAGTSSTHHIAWCPVMQLMFVKLASTMRAVTAS